MQELEAGRLELTEEEAEELQTIAAQVREVRGRACLLVERLLDRLG